MKPLSPPKTQTAPPGAALPFVLYVEDEEENWEVTELRLRSRYNLVWARDDKEACQLFSRYRDRLYAILMDIQLKGSTLNGIQLTELFRGRSVKDAPAYAQNLMAVDVPILFVTAGGVRYTEAELTAHGGNRLITKPVDFLKLNLALAQSGAAGVLEMLGKPGAAH